MNCGLKPKIEGQNTLEPMMWDPFWLIHSPETQETCSHSYTINPEFHKYANHRNGTSLGLLFTKFYISDVNVPNWGRIRCFRDKWHDSSGKPVDTKRARVLLLLFGHAKIQFVCGKCWVFFFRGHQPGDSNLRGHQPGDSKWFNLIRQVTFSPSQKGHNEKSGASCLPQAKYWLGSI